MHWADFNSWLSNTERTIHATEQLEMEDETDACTVMMESRFGAAAKALWCDACNVQQVWPKMLSRKDRKKPQEKPPFNISRRLYQQHHRPYRQWQGPYRPLARIREPVTGLGQRFGARKQWSTAKVTGCTRQGQQWMPGIQDLGVWTRGWGARWTWKRPCCGMFSRR